MCYPGRRRRTEEVVGVSSATGINRFQNWGGICAVNIASSSIAPVILACAWSVVDSTQGCSCGVTEGDVQNGKH
jgi:hypothetical protein